MRASAGGARERRGAVNSEERPRLDAVQEAELGPLVRIVEEACGDQPWALVGAAAVRLHGVPGPAPNLEFVTNDAALRALAEMLNLDVTWERGAHVAAARLRFLRGRAPVFVHANPTFHGTYDALTPLEIPSLWDARAPLNAGGAVVLATPLEWELLLAVVLGNGPRAEAIADRFAATGACDGRLLTRLMREGRVEGETEEAVWTLAGR